MFKKIYLNYPSLLVSGEFLLNFGLLKLILHDFSIWSANLCINNLPLVVLTKTAKLLLFFDITFPIMV
jgi:hypothetical protein